ncbi:MAG TPA: fatty acid oxidation complex subunit alpha FadB [Nevskiaceae bacterium]|nr:fatty acid oxidation complex subunit alpha FadB [Nevskiaceae bacterium]
MFTGQSLQLHPLDGGFVELRFDRQGAAINKFDAATLDELRTAAAELGAASGVKGLLVTSAKKVFIVGADITEFGKSFLQPAADIAAWAVKTNEIFCAIEDLPFPSVAAINGFALGGGFEMSLSTDYRVMSTNAKVGFPETKLGIIPGFGGTVRFPRLVGADNAIEWIASAAQNGPDKALKVGAVDGVVAPEKLQDAALGLLKQAAEGKYDWQARRAQKKAKLQLDAIESMMVFQTSLGVVQAQTKGQYPAPVEAVKVIQKAAGKGRDDALKIEAEGFSKLAKTPEADALIGLFLNDQLIKKKGKTFVKDGKKVNHIAVLGAGIMGGGISYQNAITGTPVVMKDIADKALDLGMSEANKLLSKQVARKKLKADKAGQILSTIRPTLNYGDFKTVDMVVEAVIENPKIKKSVLAEVEGQVKEGTIIASNTSSISIDELATVLKHPENFLGMHFFNPVHRMPLVEVIYGAKTSRQAIATVAAQAAAMKKTPIVVKNCPGFLVNRILFPYFGGWSALLRDGADFAAVDKVMEKFGWPMGPAYLQDVVGIDTSHHVEDVLAVGYPDRMAKTFRTAIDVMYEAKRYGQKNGIGFYKYELDKKGKPKKLVDPASYELLAPVQPNGKKEFSAEEIVDRLMLPMIIETARCLDEHIVETPSEADMGLVYGLGFPAFRGGALRYADSLGMKNVIAKCANYASLGKLYEPTASMRQMASAGKVYFPK